MDILIIMFRTLFFYFILVFLLYALGKNNITKFNLIDIIVLFLIIFIITVNISNPNISIWFGIIPILLLVTFQILMYYILENNSNITNDYFNKPVVIIKNGKILFKEMIKVNYSVDSLLNELKKNKCNIEDVNYASVDKNSNFKIINNKNNNEPLTLVVDGDINYDALNIINKDDNWLLNKIDCDIYNVFYAFYINKKIYIIRTDEI